MKGIFYFTAPWCSSCKSLKPHIEKAALAVKVMTIDLDQDPATAAEFDIQQLPTLIFFEGDHIAERVTGMSERVIEKLYAFAGL